MQARKRILIVAEAATLAHIARPWVLSRSLDPTRYEIVFAADDRYERLFDMGGLRREPLDSITSAEFLRALAKGQPLYDEARLRRYVEEDLALIDRVRPDLIIGDFRLSLSVSARLSKVPYATITNIYWSPLALQRYTVPDLPITHLLGATLAQPLFNLVRPLAFALHTIPLNRVRKHYGLTGLGSSLHRVYTDADYVLYADFPGLARHKPLPANHRYLGPVVWSPHTDLPPWWDALEPERPTIYATLGSSGDSSVLPGLVETLGEMPVNAMVAAAGADLPTAAENVHLAAYLPGIEAAKRADLVVCNGGSPTVQQALVAGRPVLGIAGNLDQYLNMGIVEGAGLGKGLRSDAFRPARFRQAVERLLADTATRARTQELARNTADQAKDYDFARIVETLL